MNPVEKSRPLLGSLVQCAKLQGPAPASLLTDKVRWFLPSFLLEGEEARSPQSGWHVKIKQLHVSNCFGFLFDNNFSFLPPQNILHVGVFIFKLFINMCVVIADCEICVLKNLGAVPPPGRGGEQVSSHLSSSSLAPAPRSRSVWWDHMSFYYNTTRRH